MGISKEYIYAYIDELQDAGLFTLLYLREKGFRLLCKPQKIYLENSNPFYLIEEKGFNVEKGNIRETFFINQAARANNLYYCEKSDFIDGKGRCFEVGGKNKNFKDSNSIFFAIDDMAAGFKNRIPLWLFGFLY